MDKITKDNLPPLELFKRYRKRHLTQAMRVIGPFDVETSEGTLTCQDGWLAIDSHGNPYPISDTEFQRIYDSVDD